MDFSEESVELTVKVFHDDFTDALRPYAHNPKDTLVSAVKSEQYINSTIHLVLGSQDINFSLDSMRRVDDSYRIFLHGDFESAESPRYVSCQQLMELFPSQQNILKLEINGSKQFKIFRKSDETPTLEF